MEGFVSAQDNVAAQEGAMPDTLSAHDLRRWAAQCAQQANDINRSGDEREYLLKMQSSLLALVEGADWLLGKQLAFGQANCLAGQRRQRERTKA
jgi:hypothetical protein